MLADHEVAEILYGVPGYLGYLLNDLNLCVLAGLLKRSMLFSKEQPENVQTQRYASTTSQLAQSEGLRWIQC